MAQRVLVVDDNDDVRFAASHILRMHGFEVEAASGGREALDMIEKSPPDAVVLDIMMPGMSGFEVLQYIRRNATTARIPVILVSAKSEDADVLKGYEYEADYYLPKPCSAKQLVYGVQLVLGKSAPAGGGSTKDEIIS